MFAIEVSECSKSLHEEQRYAFREAPLRMTTTRSRVDVIHDTLMKAAAAVALLLCVLGLFAKFTMHHAYSQNVGSHGYVVREGDTIFSIASRFSAGQSISTYEYQLEQETGGSTSLVPGERLILPSN